ncbi:uncharacterized protein K460DRAFT_199508 [Cucurbitaria berberidis CBS 394.84]|uniref:Uncharacterized protein n=1 Tax=Cucurbitaria berberidis CBS 394.84 TaxID=1168544 RepID=A0A9P4G9G4_9PLEO|nr:uncharacterized protein K460DRAFT_199508 [Cucurbitaria berberidis CBS 394.84]KAF1841150.1 hypothetical protein K460DRAFT_199508 [Cucurbitaria berberidis CBS 394.84]
MYSAACERQGKRLTRAVSRHSQQALLDQRAESSHKGCGVNHAVHSHTYCPFCPRMSRLQRNGLWRHAEMDIPTKCNVIGVGHARVGVVTNPSSSGLDSRHGTRLPARDGHHRRFAFCHSCWRLVGSDRRCVSPPAQTPIKTCALDVSAACLLWPGSA